MGSTWALMIGYDCQATTSVKCLKPQSHPEPKMDRRCMLASWQWGPPPASFLIFHYCVLSILLPYFIFIFSGRKKKKKKIPFLPPIWNFFGFSATVLFLPLFLFNSLIAPFYFSLIAKPTHSPLCPRNISLPDPSQLSGTFETYYIYNNTSKSLIFKSSF